MKKQGFTLIELLAVIVVLGIIMLIAVTSVSNVITKSRLNSFNASSDMLEKAASTYVNATNISVASGTTTTILYSDLKSSGFMERIVDPISKNECTSSRVYVTNTNGKYNYKGALACDNYMDIDAYNLITNGDFSNGTTGWVVAGNTQTVSNGILTMTGNGINQFPGSLQTTSVPCVTNHKIYTRARAMVTNSVCQGLMIQISGSDDGPYVNAINIIPQANTWYNLSGIVTLTTQPGYLLIRVIEDYPDAATANGKVMKVDGTSGVYVFDLTAIYGAGNEPTVAQMDKIMSNMGK